MALRLYMELELDDAAAVVGQQLGHGFRAKG
jgi:hypothetical protein